jgi:hypothetical protein
LINPFIRYPPYVVFFFMPCQARNIYSISIPLRPELSRWKVDRFFPCEESRCIEVDAKIGKL